tara:strand:+ start:9149 stop:9403 length:255 start_codon:yes stop_codon:yes gene_type:complete
MNRDGLAKKKSATDEVVLGHVQDEVSVLSQIYRSWDIHGGASEPEAKEILLPLQQACLEKGRQAGAYPALAGQMPPCEPSRLQD